MNVKLFGLIELLGLAELEQRIGLDEIEEFE